MEEGNVVTVSAPVTVRNKTPFAIPSFRLRIPWKKLVLTLEL